jgi:hypothetical protein
MAAEHLGDMTRHELRVLVEQMLDERLGIKTRPYKQLSDRPIAEVLESLREHVIVSKPSDQSIAEMLREDRDR